MAFTMPLSNHNKSTILYVFSIYLPFSIVLLLYVKPDNRHIDAILLQYRVHIVAKLRYDSHTNLF